MANAIVYTDGADYQVPVTGSSNTGSSYPVPQAPPAAGKFQVVLPSGALVASAVSIPASGSSVTYGPFLVKNTGNTVTVNGTTFAVLSFATTTATVGTNYELMQTAPSGSAPFGYALFDVKAPVAATTPRNLTVGVVY